MIFKICFWFPAEEFFELQPFFRCSWQQI